MHFYEWRRYTPLQKKYVLKSEFKPTISETCDFKTMYPENCFFWM